MMAPGQIVGGRWQIVARFAEGTWSDAYRAAHARTHAQRAIEVFHAGRVPRTALDAIARDAQIAARIDSPFVLAVVEAGWDEAADAPFIVSALPEGETLRASLDAHGPLFPEKFAIYCDQLGRALGQAHTAGIVHRALRPESLHLTTTHDGRPLVKLGGLAAGRALEEARAFAEDLSLAAYAPPELLAPARANERVTFATDVWAIAQIAYEALTGRSPAELWGASTAAEMAARVLEATPVPSQRAGAAAHLLPASFDTWFSECVALDPTHRYGSPDEALTRLRELLDGGNKPRTSLGGAVKTFVLGATPPSSGDVPAPPSTQRAAAPESVPEASSARPQTRFNVPTFDPPSGQPPVPIVSERRSPLPWILGGALVVAVLAGGAVLALRRAPVVATSADAGSDASADAATAIDNPWITIEPPPDPKAWLVGIDDPGAPLGVRGERPGQARKEGDHAPDKPFQMQEHEVTWGELEPWITGTFKERPVWARPPGGDPWMPATGVPWKQAQAYCKSPGVGGPLGDLPDEENWEYAAAGPDHVRFPWGNKYDKDKIEDLEGEGGKPARVKAKDDPDRAPTGVLGLFGNVEEWTSEQYHDDLPGQDEAWASEFKTVRGLPLAEPPQEGWSVSYRVPVCAKGACEPGSTKKASPVLRFRHLVTPVPAKDAHGTALPSLVLALEKPLRSCFEDEVTEHPLVFSIAYARASKTAAPVLTKSTGALPKATAACVEQKVKAAGEGSVDDALWWDGGEEKWEATFSAEWLARTPPDLSAIGFRCVRPVPGG